MDLIDSGYVFYAGKYYSELDFVYSSMDPNNIHYVPTVSARTALGMVIGVNLSGFKGIVLLDGIDVCNNIKYLNDAINVYKTSLLCIVHKKHKDFINQFIKPKLYKSLMVDNNLTSKLGKVIDKPTILFIDESDFI